MEQQPGVHGNSIHRRDEMGLKRNPILRGAAISRRIPRIVPPNNIDGGDIQQVPLFEVQERQNANADGPDTYCCFSYERQYVAEKKGSATLQQAFLALVIIATIRRRTTMRLATDQLATIYFTAGVTCSKKMLRCQR
mmetsp:Transcript_10226/g.24119  ORF Transcript_10226/g.24119 Transcript_10226/m.24119 type:complete len:137 (-) Transcript_10226:115-525(-)